MNAIAELFKLDIMSIFIGIFLIMTAIIAIIEIIGKFSNIIGKPVRWVKKKNEDHDLLIKTANGLEDLSNRHDESVAQSIRHDNAIKDDIEMVSDKMDLLSDQITDMQHKIDETEKAKLKDKLLVYYYKYKTIGEWSQLESEAFWDLYNRYTVHGGNSFVHETVEPIMRELRITD